MTLPYRRHPCVECPFRRDAEPGQFTTCRYDALRDTVGAPGREQPIGAPIFACHKTTEGQDQACAGWLAVCGHSHIGVRLAVAQRRLPPEALAPAADWPELFDSYDEMAATQGRHE